MKGFGNLFDDVMDALKDILDPFGKLLDSIRSVYMDFTDSLTTLSRPKNPMLENNKKLYRLHMDNKYRVHYKQFNSIKIIPRNLPYQRRNY